MNKDPDVKDCLTRRAEQCGLLKGKMASLKALIMQKKIDNEVDTKHVIDDVLLIKDNHNLVMKELKLLCQKRNLDPAEFEESSFALNSEVSRLIGVAQQQIFDLRRDKLAEELDPYEPFDSTIISSAADNPMMSESSVDIKDLEIEALKKKLKYMELQTQELESTREHVEALQGLIGKQAEDHEEESSYYRTTTEGLRRDLEKAGTTEGAKGQDPGVPPYRTLPGEYTRVGLGQEELFAISSIVGQGQADVMRHLIDESHDQQRQFQSQQKQFYNRLHTPQVELKKFDGDLTQYQSFISRYDDLVGNTECPFSVKLNTLIQSCEKSVQRHLGCCEHGPPKDGYDMARKILKTKYGKPYLVANAWIEKIMNYPKLQSPDSVATFASELRSAKETLTTMGYLSELDNTDKRRLIVAKLPSFVQNRWRKIHREANDKGSKCTIDQLVNLITQAGDEMDDPIYGAESLAKLLESSDGKKAAFKKKKMSSNVVEQSDVADVGARPKEPRNDKKKKFMGEPCCLCQGEHFTRRCAEFENMSPNERAQMVKDKNICVMCLSTRHLLKDCRFDWVCQVKGCTGKHNTTLHAALTGESSARRKDTVPHHKLSRMDVGGDHEPTMTRNEEIGHVIPMSREIHVAVDDRAVNQPLKPLVTRHFSKEQMEVYALPIVPVEVFGPGFVVNTNIMLDTGGGFTVISKRLQDLAKLKSHKEVEYSMGTLTSDEDVVSEFVTFEIRGLLDTVKHPIINASVLDRVLVDPDSVDALRDLSTWPHLRRLKMPLHDESDVDIILGQDNAHLLSFKDRAADITWRGPRACMTPVGWTVFGLSMGVVNTRTREIHATSRQAMERLSQAVEKMWAIDDVPCVPAHSPENQEILKMWSEEAKLVDGHVELPLPIKGGKLNLPNNESSVLKRHRSLEKRLLKNPELKAKFVAEMKNNFEKGYAEIVESEAEPGSELYHPIQGVTSPKKPGKCRIVGDLSCTHDGRCLNDDIAQGPNLTAHISQVMTKFRRFQVAVVGDIEKMYNQVRVPPEQRDCLRFFWWKDDEPGGELIKCRMTTQMFGGIWSAAAAIFALVWLARHYSHMYAARVIETILDHFYVDDMLDSLTGVQKTIQWLKDVRSLLMRGSFNLTKIGSNSQEVLDSLPEGAKAPAYAEVSFEHGEDIVDQTVGSVWRPLEDTLGFRTIEVDKPRTRRGVLSVMSSLYDPLGLVAPFVLVARILLQEICKMGYEWDEVIDDDMQRRWEQWLDGLSYIQQFRIPRWLGMSEDFTERYQMHVFSDASEAGYGVVLYLLIKDERSNIKRVSLLCSKAKVTPVKPVTIPRLELCAAVVAVKMEVQMAKYLDVTLEPSVFWCDSQIVISYLRGEAWQYKTFVSHRVSFIQGIPKSSSGDTFLAR